MVWYGMVWFRLGTAVSRDSSTKLASPMTGYELDKYNESSTNRGWDQVKVKVKVKSSGESGNTDKYQQAYTGSCIVLSCPVLSWATYRECRLLRSSLTKPLLMDELPRPRQDQNRTDEGC